MGDGGNGVGWPDDRGMDHGAAGGGGSGRGSRAAFVAPTPLLRALERSFAGAESPPTEQDGGSPATATNSTTAATNREGSKRFRRRTTTAAQFCGARSKVMPEAPVTRVMLMHQQQQEQQRQRRRRQKKQPPSDRETDFDNDDSGGHVKDDGGDVFLLDRAELLRSHCSILTAYLAPLKAAAAAAAAAMVSSTASSTAAATNSAKHDRQDATDTNAPPPPPPLPPTGAATANHSNTLFFMERIGTIGRFLQLLLEYSAYLETTAAAAATTKAAAAARVTEPDPQGDDDGDDIDDAASTALWCQSIVLQLLRSLCAVVCGTLEGWSGATASASSTTVTAEPARRSTDNQWHGLVADSECRGGDDSSNADGLDAPAIAAFGVATLLRLDAHYCRRRPFLLPGLWKGLCEMAAPAAGRGGNDGAPQLLLLPNTLLQQAVSALARHLADGLEPVLLAVTAIANSNSKNAAAGGVCVRENDDDDTDEANGDGDYNNAVDLKEQAFVAKILGFLVARLVTLFQLPAAVVGGDDGDDDAEPATHVYSKAVPVLTLLRGIESAVRQSSSSSSRPSHPSHNTKAEAFVQPYHLLANKVDKCLSAWVGGRSRPAARRAKLYALVGAELRPQQQHWPHEASVGMARTALGAGKALLLTKCLQDAVADEETRDWHQADIESVLLAVEELLLRALPAAVRLEPAAVAARASDGVSLLVRAVPIVSAVLRRVETSAVCRATSAAPGGRAHFHRRLVRWLHCSSQCGKSSGSNALATQLVVAVVHEHVRALSERGDRWKHDAPPLVTMLCKLLFDPRTATAFRVNIATLLTRLVLDSSIGDRLGELLRTEYKLFEQSFLSGTTKKRKRSMPAAGQPRYDPDDLAAILAFLSKRPAIRVRCTSFSFISLNVRRLDTLSVQSATIHAAQSECSAGNIEYDDLITDLKIAWRLHRDAHLALLAAAVLQQAQRICSNVDRRGDLNENLEFLTTTIDGLQIFFDPNVLDGAASGSDAAYLLLPVMEAIRLLGVIGTALTPTTPLALLHQMAQSFHAALSCPSWPVRAHALTSLVQFASTVPSTHKDILPQCVPPAMQTLLQSRLHGTVGGRVELLPWLRGQCAASQWDALAPRRRPESRVVPDAISLLTLVPGSYILTMPTHDGRSAVVIFPPGETSLDDIRRMLGDDDQDGDEATTAATADANIQTLQRVVALPDGGGGSLHLQKFNLPPPGGYTRPGSH